MELLIGGIDELEQLHASGLVVVYSGHHRELNIDVAVKVYLDNGTHNAEWITSEVERLRKVTEHPSLVTLYESGVTSSGHAYVVLELCEWSIQTALHPDRRVTPDGACLLLADIANGVEAIHDQGSAHNQIRPSNLLLSGGHCLLSGFIGTKTPDQTALADQSAGYVAPETFEETKPGLAADVYSLGATLFRLVSGRSPAMFDRVEPQLITTSPRVSAAHVPNLRNEGLPDAICLVIESAMQKEPTDRPSISDLRSMLYAAAGVAEVDSPPRWLASGEFKSPPVTLIGSSSDELASEAVETGPETGPETDPDATDELDYALFENSLFGSASNPVPAGKRTVSPVSASVSPPIESGHVPGSELVPPPPPVASQQPGFKSPEMVASMLESDRELKAPKPSFLDGFIAPKVVPETTVAGNLSAVMSVPPPPTKDSFVQLGAPPTSPGATSPGSVAASSVPGMLTSLSMTLSHVFGTIKIKSRQFLTEAKAERAPKKLTEADPPFSTEQMNAAKPSENSQPAGAPRNVDTPSPAITPEPTELLPPPNKTIETAVSAEFPAPMQQPNRPDFKASVGAKPVSEVNLRIDSDRPRLTPGSEDLTSLSQDSDLELSASSSAVLAPTAWPRGSEEGGAAGASQGTKQVTQTRVGGVVQQLRGQDDSYLPVRKDERFSRDTLVFAGAAIALFLVFSIVVALSFRGSNDQDIASVAPATATTDLTVDSGNNSDSSSGEIGNVSSGSGDVGADTSSSQIDPDSKPIVLASQIGRDGQDVIQQLNVQGVPTELVEEASDVIAAGNVIRSEPESGELEPGQVVTLYISSGPEGQEVPNVSGQPRDDAIAALQSGGFRVQVFDSPSDTVTEGLVVGSVPPGGTSQPVGSRVTLTVSTGPACAESTVPQVVGLEQSEAQEALDNVDLSSQTQPVLDGALAPGIVTSANPAAGQCTESGSSITLSVACQSVAVPSQENFTVDNANKVGLQVDIRQVDRANVEPGQFISAVPAFGTTVCAGTRVVATMNQECDLTSVPDVVGRGETNANRNIQRSDLQAQFVEENSDVSQGDVIRTEPRAGAEVCTGSQVTVYVSDGE